MAMEIIVFVCFRRWIEKTLIMGKKEEKTGQCEIIGREKTMYYDVSKTNELNGIQPLACKQELCHVIVFGIC
jgi:hypothetical protein